MGLVVVGLVVVGLGATVGGGLPAAAHGPVPNAAPVASQVTKVAAVPGTTPPGYDPDTVLTHYDFPSYPNAMTDRNGETINGQGEIVAIITTLYDPYLKADLKAFDAKYDLPTMDGLGSASCALGDSYGGTPCFQLVDATGKRPAKKVSAEGENEDAADVEWVHAAAPGADIAVVEGPTDDVAGLLASIEKAVAIPANVASISYTANGLYKHGLDDVLADADETGVVAAVGEHHDEPDSPVCPDTEYPAGSPYVLAVGGTVMSSSVGTPDTTWTETLGGLENGSGGSVVVDRPGYQSSWNSSPYRSIPDVAINAVHYSVYQSLPKKGFESVSGTSLGTPVWAGLIAEIDQARSSDGKSDLASTGLLDGIYLAGQGTEPQRGVIDPAYFSDVVYGGTSGGGCSAKKGFDQVTGLGTPDASDLVEYLGYDA